jgi:hypothetical protein
MTAEITIFDNVHGDIKSLPSDMQASVIKELAQQVHDNPKLSNKFITFLQTNLDPVMAVYGYYYSIDEGLLQPTARNFQTTMLFEQEFNHLIKYLTPSKKATLYESVADGIGLTQIELELTSPFELQPEDEIGTGTWEYVEPELPEIDDDDTANPATTTITSTPGTIKIPLKDILDTAAKKVFGVGVKKTDAEKDQEQDDRDAYHVYTQYLYQFTSAWFPNDAPTINVVSQKFWDEHECIDDQHISEYLESIIPDWSNNWCETTDSVFEYTGGSTKAEAIAYLKATGFFKQKDLFEDDESDKTDILLSYLKGQPEEVISKFLKEALTHLDDSQIADLIQKYEDAWHETVE